MKKMLGLSCLMWLALCLNVFAEGPSLKELEDQAFDFYQDKQYDQAIAVTQKALQIVEQQFGSDSLEAAKFLGNLGWLYRLENNEAEAKVNLDQARAIRAQHGATGVPLGIQTEAFFSEVDRLKGVIAEKQIQGQSETIQETPKKYKTRCGIENCHGLDITCGPNAPLMCTQMYGFGDNCRQYARCQVIDGKCQLLQNKKFDDCKACVNQCAKDFKNDIAASFGCESQCMQKIERHPVQ